jgi:hypothetical protein
LSREEASRRTKSAQNSSIRDLWRVCVAKPSLDRNEVDQYHHLYGVKIRNAQKIGIFLHAALYQPGTPTVCDAASVEIRDDC